MIEWVIWFFDVYINKKYVVSLVGLFGKMELDVILRRYIFIYLKNFINFNNVRYDVLVEEVKRILNEVK